MKDGYPTILIICLSILCIIASDAAAQTVDTLDWRKITLTGYQCKDIAPVKPVIWPWVTGGGIVAGGTIYILTKKKDKKPGIMAQNDALTLQCSGSGVVNVLANDTGEGLMVQGFHSTAAAMVIDAGNGQLQISNAMPGSFSFEYTVADKYGQTATAIVTVTVDAPELNAVTDMLQGQTGEMLSGNVLDNDIGTGITVINFTAPASGNLQWNADGSFVFLPAGCEPVTFSYTVQDICLQNAATTVSIHFTDQTAPTIQCPGDLTIDCQANADPGSTGTATATDFCDPAPVLTYTDVNSGLPCQAAISRTWKALDVSGNAANCIQLISRIDQEAPVIADCPSNLTVDCSNIPAAPQLQVTDNCSAEPGLDYSETHLPPQETPESFILLRSWTAEDACGHQSTCSYTIAVVDSTAPQISCPPTVNVACNGPNDPAITGAPLAGDNCSSVTLTYSDDNSGLTGCSNTGTLLRVWVASDENGNSSTCQQSISVLDQAPPFWMPCPPDITVGCGQQSVLGITGTAMAMDACAGILPGNYSDDDSGFQGCSGTIVRSWIASDPCGNPAPVCQQIITVVPASCDFMTDFAISPANCGANDGSVTVNLLPPGSYTLLWSDGQTGIMATHLSAGVYTVTINDPGANCTQIFPLNVDQIAPSYINSISPVAITCSTPGDIILDLNASGGSDYNIQVSGPSSVFIPNRPAGITQLANYLTLTAGNYTLTVSNNQGCSETDSVMVDEVPLFDLTVLNVTNPSCFSCSDGSIQLQIGASAQLPVLVLLNGNVYGTSNNYVFSVSNLPAGNYTVQVTDQLGNGCTADPVTATLTVNGLGWSMVYPGSKSLSLLTTPVLQTLNRNMVEHPGLGPNVPLIQSVAQIAVNCPLRAGTQLKWESSVYEGAIFQDQGLQISRSGCHGWSHEIRFELDLPGAKNIQFGAQMGARVDNLAVDPAPSFFAPNTLQAPLHLQAKAFFLGPSVIFAAAPNITLTIESRINNRLAGQPDFEHKVRPLSLQFGIQMRSAN